MFSRTLSLALGFVLVTALGLATSAQAQPYRTLDEDGSTDRYSVPGVRLGVSAGLFAYNGPNILYGTVDAQDSVTKARLGVTAHVSFPLVRDRLYLRTTAGLLNIGADTDEDAGPGQNPFLTNEVFLGEGDLLVNLISYRRSSLVPYVFTGFGALVADPFGQDEFIDALDRDRTAYFIPAGVGVDIRVSRNVSFYLEGSYRFILNEVGQELSPSVANAFGDDPCATDPEGMECKCKKFPEKPECKEKPPGEVDPEGERSFDERFRTGGLAAGFNFGFGGAPPPPPPVVVPPAPPVVPPPPVIVPPQPIVCDLTELNAIYFEYGSTSLTDDARDLLENNVQLLREHPECCLFIDGYTDTSEYDEFGMPLAGQRAQVVYDYYLDRGIAADRMHVRNRGASFPPCDKEDPEEGCRYGRRVESIPLDCSNFLDRIGADRN
ncbi:MAG: OmpA family protein [Rhodothermaceae bacterium]|nr:OmpA family protein [Rhodothermaceae bacterium]